MMEKGTMIPVKQILGAVVGIAGIGLIAFPDVTADYLCAFKPLVGAALLGCGYFLGISGRQRN